MKKKELKRNLTEAMAEIHMLKAQLAAEKINSAHQKSSVTILMKDIEKERAAHERTKVAKDAIKASSCTEKEFLKMEIDRLKEDNKSEIADIKRELALKTIELDWFHEKGSGELWSLNEFLNKMAENLEKIANKRDLEGNSIKIDIIPVPLKGGSVIAA